MESRIAELRDKEIINISDGCRFGYVGDVEVDLETGRVKALIVPQGGQGDKKKARAFCPEPGRRKAAQTSSYCICISAKKAVLGPKAEYRLFSGWSTSPDKGRI